MCMKNEWFCRDCKCAEMQTIYANAFLNIDSQKSIKAHIDCGLTEHQRFISSSLSNCHRVNDDNNKEHAVNDNNNNKKKADSIEIASSMECTTRLYYTFAVHLSIRYSQCRHSTTFFLVFFFVEKRFFPSIHSHCTHQVNLRHIQIEIYGKGQRTISSFAIFPRFGKWLSTTINNTPSKQYIHFFFCHSNYYFVFNLSLAAFYH